MKTAGEVFLMFFLVAAHYQHVVQVNEAESQLSRHFTYKMFECFHGVPQTKRHAHLFVQAERWRDGRLRDVFLSYQDLLIGADQVVFREARLVAQLRDEVVEVQNQVSVRLCDIVETSVAATGAPGIPLSSSNHVQR
ncbi:hypothetical protein T10_329 [Trichinella papuae]|uniref:Secreted protein n=1 Tax=Trichinella papuae TaxID=268474 RepID=A0A0V1M280_9BILA|nr:hypothetical protein T10_329 [Trichinella papuae]